MSMYLYLSSVGKWIAGRDTNGDVVLVDTMSETLPFKGRHVREMAEYVRQRSGEMPVKLMAMK